MLPFFRKMRWRLARDNQFFKYTRYAIGEILLIVIGIIIALQLQNWNQNRLQEQKFKTVLEQIYNSVDEDVETFNSRVNILQIQSQLIDTLLVDPDRFDRENIPGFLYWLTQNMDEFSSETSFHLSNLEFNPENPEQNEIARLITTYVDKNDVYREILATNVDVNDKSLWELLQKNSIPNPGGLSPEVTDEFLHVEENYFNESEIQKVMELMESPYGQSLIKSKFNVNMNAMLYANNRYEDAVSIQKIIKNYHPEVRVLYKDVGVIGTALRGYIDVPSEPLIQTDVMNSIWEDTLTFSEGSVKFRCRDSWSQNWGGNTFPTGEAVWFGPNIEVEPGRYHVRLDLSQNTYSFEKIEIGDVPH